MNKDRPYACKHCGKSFTAQSNRSRHEKKCHCQPASHPQSIHIQAGRDQYYNCGSGNQTVYNTNITLTVPHGDEDLSYITPEWLRRKYWIHRAILEAVKETHGNVKHPETMNCYISNWKDRIARVYKGPTQGWQQENADECVRNIYEKFTSHIEAILKDLGPSDSDTGPTRDVKATLLEYLGDFVDRWESKLSNIRFENMIHEELGKLLYNTKVLLKTR